MVVKFKTQQLLVVEAQLGNSTNPSPTRAPRRFWWLLCSVGAQQHPSCPAGAQHATMLALIYCLAISVLYVVSLYVWRGVPPDRQHPDTVKARMLGVLLTCCVAWLPTWHMRNQVCANGWVGLSSRTHIHC